MAFSVVRNANRDSVDVLCSGQAFHRGYGVFVDFEWAVVQCVQFFFVWLRDLVILGDFQNYFRPKNLNFHNQPTNVPEGRAGKAILKISIFWPKIILKISKKDQIED